MPTISTSKQMKSQSVAKGSMLRGRLVRVMTPEERLADIKDFGREIRKSKASALAFLKEAGFIDESGEIAEPYRA